MAEQALLPDFQGVSVWSDGRVTLNGEEIEPEDWYEGDPRYRVDDGRTLMVAPMWKLILSAVYYGPRGDCQPTWKDGDRSNNDLDNIVFVYTDDQTGDERAKRWRPVGRFRKFDARMKSRIRILETGEVFGTLQEVADRVGGHRSNVSACLHGRLARYKGFTYVYTD